jgi:pilus assembly protein Flp/PilA
VRSQRLERRLAAYVVRQVDHVFEPYEVEHRSPRRRLGLAVTLSQRIQDAIEIEHVAPRAYATNVLLGGVAWRTTPGNARGMPRAPRLEHPRTPRREGGRSTMRRRGQGLVEYGLIIALVAVLVIAGLIIFGPAVTNLLSSLGRSA